MKKLLLALLSACTLVLSSCGNWDASFGQFSFHYVHIQMYNMNEPIHMRVSGWKGDEGGVELHTEKHGTILLGDGTYMMYDTEDCPICGDVQYK